MKGRNPLTFRNRRCIFFTGIMEFQTETKTLIGSIKVAFVFQLSFVVGACNLEIELIIRETTISIQGEYSNRQSSLSTFYCKMQKRNPECEYCCLVFYVAFKLNIDRLITANSTFYRLLLLMELGSDSCRWLQSFHRSTSQLELLTWRENKGSNSKNGLIIVS